MRLLFLVLIFIQSGTDTCGKAGIQIYNDVSSTRGEWTDGTEAYVTWSQSFNWRFLGFRGSFVAQSTCGWTFTVNHDYLSGSTLSSIAFTLDGDTVTNTAKTYSRTLSPFKDFRYNFQAMYTKDHTSSWMELQISYQGEYGGEYHDIAGRIGTVTFFDGSFFETCAVNSCLDTGLSRSPYDCKPPPTSSRSRSPSPSATMSGSPTESRSPTSLFSSPVQIRAFRSEVWHFARYTFLLVGG
jgi:hypothetical protein